MIKTTHNSKAKWISARTYSVGASESPVLFGKGYKDQTPLTVYQKKVAPSPNDNSDNESMMLGRYLEPGIRSAFAAREGLKVDEPLNWTSYYAPDQPRISATPDGFVHEGINRGCLEIKYVANQYDQWADGAPDRVWIQLQQQMFVTGLLFGWIAAVIGGELHTSRHERDDAFCLRLRQAVEKFWKLVECREEPIATAYECDSVALTRLHPDDNGQIMHLDKPEDLLKYGQFLASRSHAKEADENKTALKNYFKARIGDNSYGRLPDGRGFSLKTHDKFYKAREARTSKARPLLVCESL